MKIVLFAILPDWNSLDSVRQAHSDLELAGLVFFALLVVAEALAHNSKQETRKHLFDSIGIWFFAIAVLCEIAGYWYGQRNDALSEQVIVSLDAKAKEASSNASSALTKSSEADTKADAAETASGKATTESSAAMTIASGARREADTFERDIVSAKTLAAGAESHLAEALKEAASARAELTRLKARRLLVRDSELVSILSAYHGTEYMFLSVFGDDESITLLKQIDDALQRAGWDRGPHKGTPFPPALNIYSSHGTFAVTEGFAEGLEVSVQSTQSPTDIGSLPAERIQRQVLAAGTLNSNLASHLVPAQDGLGKKLGIQASDETMVLITVGKKAP